MRHVILTCLNHPNLRWSTKEIAITEGKYNGARGLFFLGIPSGRGMYSDGSGLDCTNVIIERNDYGKVTGYKAVEECNCKSDCLIIAEEDKLVKRD